jgi:hypothetical protein
MSKSRGSGHHEFLDGPTVKVLHRLCSRTDAEMPEGPFLAWYGREFQQISDDGQWLWDWGTIVKTTACKRHRCVRVSFVCLTVDAVCR